ncbi:unnamed protein product [Moneuplotes crassus]|uniref:Uncharacterized protein n=1 Tax=Euplotes crassus TaxID=5936 RepID=A0AAD1UQF2_EUPCR|nr:unnamed protein product [Moneuplotes crassus]
MIVISALLMISICTAKFPRYQRNHIPNYSKIADTGSVIYQKLEANKYFVGEERTSVPTQAPTEPLANTSQPQVKPQSSQARSSLPAPSPVQQSQQPQASPHSQKSGTDFRKVDSYQQFLINSLKSDFLREFENLFDSVTAVGSDHVFDLIEFYDDKILLIDFYTKRGNHEKVIKDLKTLIGDNQACYDQILYVDVNAELKYEFYNILYDLNLLMEPLNSFPYFLVLKGGQGDMITGEDSAQLIYTKVTQFLS